jgi:hypothetical protein
MLLAGSQAFVPLPDHGLLRAGLLAGLEPSGDQGYRIEDLVARGHKHQGEGRELLPWKRGKLIREMNGNTSQTTGRLYFRVKNIVFISFFLCFCQSLEGVMNIPSNWERPVLIGDAHLLLERITMMMMDPFRQRDRHSL